MLEAASLKPTTTNAFTAASALMLGAVSTCCEAATTKMERRSLSQTAAMALPRASPLNLTE